MRLPTRFLLAGWLIFIAVSPASAVIISGGDGSGNKSAPDGDQGWSYVGTIGGACGVYLGDGWVLTAYHDVRNSLGGATFTLNGGSYSADTATWKRLTTTYNNSGTLTTADADLEMVRVVGTPQTPLPALSGMQIASGAYDTNMLLTAIGNGRNRATGETYWDASWDETTSPSTYAGYRWGTPADYQKRWGTNTLTTTTSDPEWDGYGTTQFLTTTFDQNDNLNEMQAAPGDSGGGVFVEEGGVWKLAGIMEAIGGVDDKDSQLASKNVSDTAVYGDITGFADLREYSGQIQGIMSVPEPSTLALLAGGAAAWLLWRRRAARGAAV